MTPLPDKRETGRKTLLLLIALGLSTIEFFMPRVPILPWLKPGLANAVTILWIIRYGTLDALLFVALRTWIVAFYFGFSLVTMTIGMSGALCAVSVMGCLWWLGRKGQFIGLVGLSVCGALSHTCGQLGAVYLLLAHSISLWYQFPLMVAAACLFGTITGVLAWGINRMVDGIYADVHTAPRSSPVSGSGAHRIVGWGCIAAAIAVAFIDAPLVLGIAALAATAITQWYCSFSLSHLIVPLKRFWLLFLGIGIVLGFFSYGERILSFSSLTYEGLHTAGLQWLRLWTWLQLSAVANRSGFFHDCIGAAHSLFPGKRDTIQAGVQALGHFPLLFDIVKNRRRFAVAALVRRPVYTVRTTVQSLVDDLYKGLTAETANTEDR